MQFDMLYTPLDLSLQIALTTWTGTPGHASHWRVDSKGQDGAVRLLLGRGDSDVLPGFNLFLVPGSAEDLTSWVARWLGQAKMPEVRFEGDGENKPSHRIYSDARNGVGTHEDALASPNVLCAIEPVWEYIGK